MTQRQRRRRFSQWLRQLLVGGSGNRRSNISPMRNIPRLARLEPLESRQLLAADSLLLLLGSAHSQQIASVSTELAGSVGIIETSGNGSMVNGNMVNGSMVNGNRDQAGFRYGSGESAVVSAGSLSQPLLWSTSTAEGEWDPEGQAADDLVAFAKALAATDTKFYGADWCRFCADQKRLFQDGGKYLPYVEVTNPDRSPNQIAIDNNITTYPTWVFPDGSRLEGLQSLQTISQRSGVAIPQSSLPYLPQFGNVNVGIGSPLHIPVDAYHPSGQPLSITVTSDNPNLIGASVLSGNRSLRISTDYGDMVFELFEDKAPRPAGRVIELAQSGFYDGIIFHRVIDGFMIQGGDPTGTGTSGSPLGNFDDQFHLDLQHNRSGVLSFAKAGDDTNNSQFFITAGPTRHLDFNHSVFGQIVEGDSVRSAISKTATNASDRPINNVIMREVTVFQDAQNGVVLLKPTGTGTGSANITITVTDGQGNSTSRTFAANVGQDTANGAPFLNDIPTLQVTSGTTLTYTLTSQDKEGDAVIYSVEPLGTVAFDLNVNSQTGVVTLTPPANFVGQLQFLARVRQATPTTTGDPFDNQVVTVEVGAAATLGLSLSAASDSGPSNSDGITNATSLVFTVTGTTPGATVEVLAGGQVVGLATASSATTQVNVQSVTTLGEGAVQFSARQRVNSQINGISSTLPVVLDRTPPVPLPLGAFPATANVGVPLVVNLNHPEEGSGLIYALENAPSGMTIGATNGIVNWTPLPSQLGPQSLTLLLTDLAGNEQRQTFNLAVGLEPAMGIRLDTVSTVGAPVGTVQVGQQFIVQVYVQDLRQGSDAAGVFSAYMNVLFDPAIIQPIAESPINHIDPYRGARVGTVASGAIVGLGAVANSTDPLGPSERLFAELTFTAIASGNPNLRTEFSNNPSHDVGLYNRNDAVGADEILFGTSSFAVGIDFQLNDDIFNFDEDTGPHTLNVLSNDNTQSGVVLTIVGVSAPSGGGTVSIAADGRSLQYRAANNFHGAETFTYTAANAQGVQQTATVTIQITEVNDPPVAVDDVFEVIQNSAVNVLDVLANDSQGADEGVFEVLTVIAVTPGSAGGNVQIGPSGLNVRYTPVPGFIGTETFTYTLSDGRGGTDQATVTVTVRPAIPPPTAVDDSFTLLEDSPLTSFDVLANDIPVQASHTLIIRSVGKSQVGSTTSISSDGQLFLYQPAPNFAGQEIITYTVEASDGGIATGRVTFTVTNVNDPPTAVDDNLTITSSGGPVNLNVLVNDFDVDAGDTFTITAVTQPATGLGAVAIAANGQSLIYTPPSNTFEGTVVFTYTITDTTGLTDSATVTLNVQSFTPRKISGRVQFGNGTDGVLQQLEIRLSGDSMLGSTVNQTAVVGPEGDFQFNSLAPGEYRLTRAPIPFFNDGGEELVVTSGPNDGDVVADFVINGGLSARHIDLRDFLGSTFRRSLTAAVEQNVNTQWVAPNGTWNSLSNLSFQINTNDVILTAVNGTQQTVSASIPLNHRLLSRTTEQGRDLIKLRGDVSQFNLTPVNSGTAEGEANSSTPVNTLVAEGESLTGGGSGQAIPVANTLPLMTSSGTRADRTVASGGMSVSGIAIENQLATTTLSLSNTQIIGSLLGSSRSSDRLPSSAASRSGSVVDQALVGMDLGLDNLQ
jgi:cyclophilin family peptidyl-prolyl cis-trans isomerase